MTVLLRTDPAKIISLVQDLKPPRNPSRDGYGDKLPTSYRIKLDDNRWRRVYAICYGNAASVYVNSAGHRLFLDIDTEYALTEGLPSSKLGQLK